MTAKQRKRSADLHEAFIRLTAPKPANRKQRRARERRIQKMREAI